MISRISCRCASNSSPRFTRRLATVLLALLTCCILSGSLLAADTVIKGTIQSLEDDFILGMGGIYMKIKLKEHPAEMFAIALPDAVTFGLITIEEGGKIKMVPKNDGWVDGSGSIKFATDYRWKVEMVCEKQGMPVESGAATYVVRSLKRVK